MNRKVLIYGGGPYHPTHQQADWFRPRIESLGCEVIYSESRSLFDRLDQADLLIISALDWSEAHKQSLEHWETPQHRKTEYAPLSDTHFDAIREYIQVGKSLMCHHCAIANWDERPEFNDIFDGRWIWGQSNHTPVGMQVATCVVAPEHPICRGMSDFSLTDELYYKLAAPRRSQILLEATHDAKRWPLAWAGSTPGGGRYVYSGLGHDMLSFASPCLDLFLTQAITWLLDSQTKGSL